MQTLSRETRIQDGMPTQAKFEELIDEIATTRMQKVNSYGEDYYKQTDPNLAMVLVYGDLQRKLSRIKHAVTTGQYTASDKETLREAFKDIANYGLMGMQLFDQFFPEEETPFDNQENQLARFDQLALVSNDPKGLKVKLEAIFDRPMQWHDDQVSANGFVYQTPTQSVGNLAFNYDGSVIEFEILSYESGDNWLKRDDIQSGLSHIGIHVPDGQMDEWMSRMKSLGYNVAQEMKTFKHTNPEITGKRTYRYMIYDTISDLGFYLKLIERIMM